MADVNFSPSDLMGKLILEDNKVYILMPDNSRECVGEVLSLDPLTIGVSFVPLYDISGDYPPVSLDEPEQTPHLSLKQIPDDIRCYFVGGEDASE